MGSRGIFEYARDSKTEECSWAFGGGVGHRDISFLMPTHIRTVHFQTKEAAVVLEPTVITIPFRFRRKRRHLRLEGIVLLDFKRLKSLSTNPQLICSAHILSHHKPTSPFQISKCSAIMRLGSELLTPCTSGLCFWICATGRANDSFETIIAASLARSHISFG